jgi:hypothetical protein
VLVATAAASCAKKTPNAIRVRESQEQLLAALAEAQATIPSTYRFKN